MWLDFNDLEWYYFGVDKGMFIIYDYGKSFILFDNFVIG